MSTHVKPPLSEGVLVLHVCILIAATFLAAYGNAMRKVTWRRRLAAERGDATAGTSKTYDISGLVILNAGVVAMVAWAVWVAFGNPVEFVQDTF